MILNLRRQHTLIIDNNVDLTVLLQVLSRLESLGAIGIVLGLIHLVNSVENNSGASETDTST